MPSIDIKIESADSDSHVVTLPLKTEKWQDDLLEKKFNEATEVYNRTLEWFITKRNKLVDHPAWKKAQQADTDKARDKFYKKAEEAVEFAGWVDSSNKAPASLKNELTDNTQLETHLSAGMTRLIMARAIQSVYDWHFNDQDEPSYKSSKLGNNSLNCIDAFTSIKFKGGVDVLRVGAARGQKPVEARVDSQKLRGDSGKQYRESVKSVKDTQKIGLVRKRVDGEVRYFAHVTCDGEVPISNSVNVRDGRVGVDIGVRSVAAVSDNQALLDMLVDTETLNSFDNQLEQLQRELSHKQVLNNPDAFDEDGAYIKGHEVEWSEAMELKKDKINELHRKMNEERKRQHYQLINRLLEMGNYFVVEDNTYSGWQAGIFGKQVKDSAPKTFVDRLAEKAKSAGGDVKLVSTWDTKLSSRCHCGREKSSELDDRWHSCGCGVECQRDLYSAFLAKNVYDGDLDVDQCREDWPGIERSLHEASSKFQGATWSMGGNTSRGPDRDGDSPTCAKSSMESVGQADANASGGS